MIDENGGPVLACMIRRVELEDASGVFALEQECFSDPYSESLIDHLLRTERDRFFVAVANDSGRIVGYTAATINGRSAHLLSIAVHPLHRGQGIGTNLFSIVMKELLLSNATQISLEVRETNLHAISFYSRMGFKEVSQIRHYYDDGEDALVMKKTLTDPLKPSGDCL